MEISAKILKVEDEKFCVEFNKGATGDVFEFYGRFNEIRSFMSDFENATY